MARILLVDDSVIIRRNLKVILARLGHEIVGEASDGLEAFKAYKECKPDLVTMDISMPNSSGIEATHKIIEYDPKASIVMISALRQKKDIMEALDAGAKYFIIKPFTDDKVKEVIDKVTSNQ